MIKQGSWVSIHNIVLNSDERASHLPEDTKQVPLEMWTKGYLLNDANIGDMVEIETIVGRTEKGTLLEVNPSYKHNYGEFVPEILEIGKRLKKELFEGENNE